MYNSDFNDFVYLESIKRYGTPLPTEVAKRIEYELEIIESHALSRAFMAARHAVKIASYSSILTGPGRGSLPGSIVSYCLGITGVDPLKYGLRPEPFLETNTGNFEVFIDCPENMADQLEQMILKYYGGKHAAIVGPGKIPRDQIGSGIFIAHNNRFCGHFCLNDKGVHEIRNEIVHESGPADGCVINICRLSDLDIISGCVDRIKETSGIDIDPYDIPLDDDKVFSLLSEGFPLNISMSIAESDIQLSTCLSMLKLDNFNQLIDIYSLNRPGPIEGGLVSEYIRRGRNSNAASASANPVESCLSDTYGILLYNEQLMRVLHEQGGFDYRECNKIRKAMGIKHADQIQAYRELFVKNTDRLLREKSQREAVFNSLAEQINYAFAKSHAVSYAMIIYWIAYMKVHFPEEYRQAESAAG